MNISALKKTLRVYKSSLICKLLYPFRKRISSRWIEFDSHIYVTGTQKRIWRGVRRVYYIPAKYPAGFLPGKKIKPAGISPVENYVTKNFGTWDPRSLSNFITIIFMLFSTRKWSKLSPVKTFKFTGGLGRDVLFWIVFLGAQKNFDKLCCILSG